MPIKSIKWDGRQVSRAGCYSNISLQTYHSAQICTGPSISSSGLRKAFGESLAHFHVSWPGNPNCIEDEDKPHFILGRALHHLMLGERFFSKLFAVQPAEFVHPDTGQVKDWHYANKFCKEWRTARQQEGRAILTQADVTSLMGMAESLSREPIVIAGALNGQIERSLFWQDKKTKLWLKARPDAIPGDGGDFVDLKKTRSVFWPDLQNTIFEYGYHQQGALIRTAAREVLDIGDPSFTLIFCEDTPPYCPREVTLKTEDLDRGERANRMAIDAIAACIESGRWPGPGAGREDAEYIELTDWQKKSIDNKLEFGIS